MQQKKICFLSPQDNNSIEALKQVNDAGLGIVEFFDFNRIEEVPFDKFDFIILTGNLSFVINIVNKYIRVFRIPMIYIENNPETYIVNSDFTVINFPVTKNNLCTAMELAELKCHTNLSTGTNKYFQKLIQNSTDLTLIIDDEGLISFVSPIINQILGFKRFEIVGDNIFSFICPDDRSKLIKVITGKSEIKNPLEIRFRNKDRKYVWMEANISDCTNVELIGGFILNARDISDRKLVQESYKEEKSIFQSILQNAPDAFVLFNGKGEIHFLNCAFTRITGFGMDDISNINDWIRYALPEKYGVRDILRSLGGKNKHRSTKIKDRDGEIVDVEYDIIELHNESLLLTMKDVTKYKKSQLALSNSLDLLTANKFILENRNSQLAELNKKLTESEKKLFELNLSKDKFFSIIAHDLRSPFNSLLGMTNLVISEYDYLKRDEVLRFLDDIKNSSQNIFRLLENLLSWAKLNSGLLEYNPKEVDLYEITSTVKSTLNYNAKHKNINLINNISKNQYVLADEQMLHSVFQNLLSNSIKFTEPGGQVIIDSEIIGDQNYNISVKDSGVGIREEDIDSIFRIDVNNSTKGTLNETGSGIGLILCKEFVEKNGGTIEVSSTFGKGTTFSFSVPAVANVGKM